MRRKKVLIHSNFCKKNTGFAKAKRNILLGLYALDKYDIVELANGEPYGRTFSTPWKTHGTYPSNQRKLEELKNDGAKQAEAGYGGLLIDKFIEEEQPDVYIGVEDIWAFNDFETRAWWNQITPVVWTTLDSLPILSQAYDVANHTENFYVWAEFAEREMKKDGLENVKTLHGPIDHNHFFRLSDEERKKLRAKNGLKDEFIIGFVFRNQLRKSVPNLLDGFLKFKKKNPQKNAKLLLHTSWSEGWDIPALVKERGMDLNDILTTYYCSSCKEYLIMPFCGEKKTCPFCGAPTLSTTNITEGVDEKQLNEIYNLMDVYCHPFTSGGQEIPVQEAKMCELITLVTNYSCGEEYCIEESGGLPLNWSEYREQGSQFIKATTSPDSIAFQLEKVANMSEAKRSSIGKTARKFIMNNFSIDAAVKEFERIIDNAPFVENVTVTKETRDIDFVPDPYLNDEQWVESIFKGMLKRPYTFKHRYCQEVIRTLQYGVPREHVVKNLIEVAKNENAKIKDKIKLESLLDEDDKGRRIAVVLPQSAGDVFLATSVLRSIKDRYPDHNIYFITKRQYFDLLDDCPYVHKCLDYIPQLDNPLFLEGQGSHKGYFEVCYRLHVICQIIADFSKNGKDIIDLDLEYK